MSGVLVKNRIYRQTKSQLEPRESSLNTLTKRLSKFGWIPTDFTPERSVWVVPVLRNFPLLVNNRTSVFVPRM